MVAQGYSISKAVPPWQKQSSGMLSSGVTHYLWRYLVSCFLKTVKRGRTRYLSLYFGSRRLHKSCDETVLVCFCCHEMKFFSSALPLVSLLSWSMLKNIWRLKVSISAFTRTEKTVVSSQPSPACLSCLCCWNSDCCLTSVPPSLFFQLN